jgi:hypothetical protein
MALTKCKECKKEVSTKADKCPHCGAPVKKQGGLLRATGVILVMLVAIPVVISLFVDRPHSDLVPAKKSPATKTEPATAASQAAQAKRKEAITELMDDGVFYKTEYSSNNVAHLYVDTAFYKLNIDDKKTATNIVFAYFQAAHPNLSALRIMDGKTGKDIGKFSEYGLDLD